MARDLESLSSRRHVVAVVAVLFFSAFAGRALGADAADAAVQSAPPTKLAPYWMETGQTARDARYMVPWKKLTGRRFLFSSNDKRPEPRYGRLTVLTFEDGAIHERRPMVDVRHRVAFQNTWEPDELKFTTPAIRDAVSGGVTTFILPEYIVIREVASFKGVFVKGGRPPLRQLAVDTVDADQGLFQLVQVENAASLNFGKLEELDADAAAKWLATIERAEKAEAAQRKADAQAAAAGNRPLPYVDFFDFRNGRFIEDVYYGRFGKDSADDQDRMRDNQRIKGMFLAYHDAYGLEYLGDARARGETIIEFEDYTVTTDAFGNTIDESPRRFRGRVRQRYAKSFSFARSAEKSVGLGAIFGGGVILGFADMVFQPAMTSFLAANYKSSPATVERMEQNLDRFLNGREPLTMDAPAGRAPYAALADRHVDALAHQGLRWTTPAGWTQARERNGFDELSRTITRYTLRDGTEAMLMVKYPAIADPLATVNFWRKREYQPAATSLDDVKHQSFTVQGREVKLFPMFNMAGALVEDGGRTWMIIMQGFVTAENLAAFREWIEGYQWDEVTDAQMAEWARAATAEANRPVRGGRRDTRKPPPGQEPVADEPNPRGRTTRGGRDGGAGGGRAAPTESPSNSSGRSRGR